MEPPFTSLWVQRSRGNKGGIDVERKRGKKGCRKERGKGQREEVKTVLIHNICKGNKSGLFL